MHKELHYKGYDAETAIEDGVIVGTVAGIRDVVTFEGENVADLVAAFQSAVDDYLADCKAVGKTPDRAFKGAFQVRVKPRTHRRLYLIAKQRSAGKINAAAQEAIDEYIERHSADLDDRLEA